MENIDYEKMLHEKLMAKLKEQNDPNYGADDRAEMAGLRQNDSRNALAAALMKSAAQVGTIGGKAADTSSVDQMAQSLARTNQMRLGEIGDRRAQADKQYQMNADVYKYLSEKQQKQAQAEATAKYRGEVLGQNKAKAEADAKAKQAEVAEAQRRWEADHSLNKSKLA